MRIFLVLVITLFTVCISELFAQGAQNKLQITYVANEGYLLHADVAFLYYEMLNSVDDLKYIISKLKPKKIIIMHVPLYLNAQWQQKKEELKTVFPELYLMNKAETVSLY